MEAQTTNQVKHLVKQDDSSRVYEGEIIVENQEPAAVEKKIDVPQSIKLAYKLGKMFGYAITLISAINETGHWIKTDRKGPGDGNRIRRRGKRRFRRMRKRS